MLEMSEFSNSYTMYCRFTVITINAKDTNADCRNGDSHATNDTSNSDLIFLDGKPLVKF